MGIKDLWTKATSYLPLRSNFTRPKASSVIPVGQLPVYPALNPQTYVAQYNTNSTVYTIINLMAKKFAVLPRVLAQIEDTATEKQYKRALKNNAGMKHSKLMKMHDKSYRTDDPVIQNPLTDLLDHPNEYMGQDQFYAAIYTYKKLTGNSFVWLNRGDNDSVEGDARYKLPVLEMHVLPSQFMTITVDRQFLFGEIVNYVLYDQGQPIYFQKEDIIHWRDPNPRYDGYNFTHYYGLSPLEAGMQLLTQDRAGRDAMVAMYQNGGARGVLYNESFNNLTPEQLASGKSAIDTKINNRAQKSAVAMLPGTWGYLQLGDSAVDMEFVETMDKVFQRCCNLLGCNPQLFETKTTFNNVEQARKDLITNAIMPDACSYRDEENRVLLQAFGLDKTKYTIDIDIDDIPELQDDMEKVTKRVLSAWVMTPNEMREELGMDDLDEPGMDEPWVPTTLAILSDAAVPTNQLSADAAMGGDDTTGSGSSGMGGNGKEFSHPKMGGKLLPTEADVKWNAELAKIKH